MGTFDKATVIRFNLVDLGFHFYDEDNPEIYSRKAGIEKEFYIAEKEKINNILDKCANDLRTSDAYKKLKESKGAKVIFIGDSLTSDQCGHCEIIKRLFEEDKHFEIIKSAVSGDTTLQVTNRFYGSVMALDFDIAIIMLGTNDCRKNNDEFAKQMVSLDEYKNNMEYFIKLIQSKGKKVILNTMPPVDWTRVLDSFADDNYLYEEDVMDAYNKVIRNLAQDYGCCLVDSHKEISEFFEGDPFIYDGLHLNFDAQKKLAYKELEALVTIIK